MTFWAQKLTEHCCPIQCWEVTNTENGGVVLEDFVWPAVYWNQPLLQTASKYSTRLVLLITGVKLQTYPPGPLALF